MSLRKIIKGIKINNVRCYSKDYTKYQQQSVRVAVLGADTEIGRLTALLLKQNPLVSGVFLQGEFAVKGIAADLKEFDTRSRVVGYTGPRSVTEAARSADIILILNSKDVFDATTAKKAFKAEAARIREIAKECSTYAPKSVLVCAAHPVSLNLPFIRNIYKKGHWYHPGRIIGSVAGHQVKIISMISEQQGLDPRSVNIPMFGGPDVDCLVPLYSRATPVALTSYEAMVLLKKFRGLPQECDVIKSPIPFKPDFSTMAEAYGLNQMATTIGLGLCGDAAAIGTAFVRTNVISGCTHCVCTIKYGKTGVYHNYGVPRVTEFELRLLEKAILLLQEREKYVSDYLSFVEEKEKCEEEQKQKLKEKRQKKKKKQKCTMEDDEDGGKQGSKEVEIPFEVDQELPCKIGS